MVFVTHPSCGGCFQAKLILALADGVSYSRIERELGTSGPTIARWKARFDEGRIAALEGLHKGSRVSKATPAMQARVLKNTQTEATGGTRIGPAGRWLRRPDSARPRFTVSGARRE